MNFLPKDLENIIVDYQTKMEHLEKFQASLDKINEIEYIIDGRYTWRTHDNVTAQYYGGLNHADTLFNSHNELWVHTYIEVDGIDEEYIKIIFEEFSGLHAVDIVNG